MSKTSRSASRLNPKNTADASLKSLESSDLAALVSRCRLKAKALRWAKNRHQLIDEGVNITIAITPKDNELIQRARELGDCYLWMCRPAFLSCGSPVHLEEAASCFEAVADSVEIMRLLLNDVVVPEKQHIKALFNVIAEAQSALRVAIQRVVGQPDRDQVGTFHRLKEATQKRRLHIRRHMNATDPADPAAYPKVRNQIEAIGSAISAHRRATIRRQSRLIELRKLAKLITSGMGTEHDRGRLVQTVHQLVQDGLPPSSKDLREVLLPLLERGTDWMITLPGFAQALREIDQYRASLNRNSGRYKALGPTTEAVKAAGFLKDRTVLLIGGELNQRERRTLEQALGLKKLIWISPRKLQSMERSVPDISLSAVTLVVLAMHSSGRTLRSLKRLCRQSRKPLILLPGSPGVDQLADRIRSHVSDLEGKSAAVNQHLSNP